MRGRIEADRRIRPEADHDTRPEETITMTGDPATTAETTTEDGPAHDVSGRRGLADLITAEWLKLRTLRSAQAMGVTVLALMATAVVLTLVRASAWAGATAAERAAPATTEAATLQFIQLLAGIVGALAVTAEYRTGSIRSTLTAAPARTRLLTAKAIVVAAATLGAGLLLMPVSYAVNRLTVGDVFPAYEPSLVEKAPILLYMALSIALCGVVGFGLGVVLRSAAGAIVLLTLVQVFAWMILVWVPQPVNSIIYSVLPPSLPRQLDGVPPLIRDAPNGHPAPHTLLSVPGAWAVVAAWIGVAFGGALLVFRRRDVR